jgi:hypothetical protein
MCRTCSNMAHKTDFSVVWNFKIFPSPRVKHSFEYRCLEPRSSQTKPNQLKLQFTNLQISLNTPTLSTKPQARSARFRRSRRLKSVCQSVSSSSESEILETGRDRLATALGRCVATLRQPHPSAAAACPRSSLQKSRACSPLPTSFSPSVSPSSSLALSCRRQSIGLAQPRRSSHATLSSSHRCQQG